MAEEESRAEDCAEKVSILELFNRWCEERGVSLECAACGHRAWQPSTLTATPWVHPEGLPVFINEQPTFYLLIPVFCKNCSFMVFFNAGKMLKLPSYFPEEVAEPEDEFPEVLM